MQRIRVDFNKRDERDRIPIPENVSVQKGEAVILYDDDIEVMATRSFVPGKLDIDWSHVKVSSWKKPPPEEVQKEIEEFPKSPWKHWPED